MNENVKKVWEYFWGYSPRDHIQSVATVFVAISVIFTFVSGTSIDVYVTRSEINANAQQIQKINAQQQTDMQNILILQQIAKDNVDAEKATEQQLQTLNDNFQLYLLNKIK